MENIKVAFSRQSLIYDQYESGNLTLKFMRNEVRNHVTNFLRYNDKILELNAGTGTDAVYFAEKGFKVHATDIAPGMLEKLRIKVESRELCKEITIQQCSFTELDKIENPPFDYIFSNFGGLNCASDLTEVAKFFPVLLNKNGRVTFVIMPPFCPWEAALIFRGKFKTAFRRLKRNGTLSHLEGECFNTYYYTPNQLINALGKNFKVLNIQGLASFTPPPYMENFPKRHSSIFKYLNKLDKKFSYYFPFNRFADHFILTAEYLPL